MTVEFRLPDVGEGLEEAEIVRWLVGVGEAVERDQSIVEMQTDKALVEIPAPASGMVSRLVGEEGALVKVGELLFVIDNGAPSGRGARRSRFQAVFGRFSALSYRFSMASMPKTNVTSSSSQASRCSLCVKSVSPRRRILRKPAWRHSEAARLR